MKKIMLSMLLAYTASFASSNASTYKSGLLLPPQADIIYKNECSQCHGNDGKQISFEGSARVTYGVIAGLNTEDVAKTLKEYRGGVKSKDYQSLNKYGYGALMKSVTKDLSWAEIDAVAKYVNGLK